MKPITKEEALNYHEFPRPGKIESVPFKRCADQRDLSLTYTPGVADVCMAIHADETLAGRYTGKENLVGVITNGTAVLGLGNIGPAASKPVMEGKAAMFKMFADINCFDIELNLTDPEAIITAVKAMEPTFGGINLEDIKAPECFYIEECLKKEMGIPVFHDDQHGTAVISGAGLLNAMELAGKKLKDCKVVVVGAGAAGIACSRIYVALGIARENLFLFDTKGLIHTGRTDLNPYKLEFAQASNAGSLATVMQGADIFLGLSKKDTVTKSMVKSMSANAPTIFACANPDPEISPADAKDARPDCIMCTGRSDYPNQINNVSGFPFIFRGALDVAATTINEAMKIAAARALAALAKEPVPAEVSAQYKGETFSFGPEYVIPKPLDSRIIEWVTPAVAQAAMDSGVARKPIADMEAYRKSLKGRIQSVNERIAAYSHSLG